ncbi:hypothetical protein RB195_024750 [Necator americanus]
MSSAPVFVIALFLIISSMAVVQRIPEQRSDLSRLTAVARELKQIMRQDKRDFRFHAARGKKNDPERHRRYGFTH